MILLAFGILLFTALHMVAVLPGLKARFKAHVGERLYGPVYGMLSLASLAIIILGWRASSFVAVYDPPSWGWLANYGLTFLAFLCLGIFLFRGTLRQRLRFPMALAVMLWGTGHLLANGDAASLLLFGGFIASGLLMLLAGIANNVRPSPEVRAGHDGLSLLAGAALYALDDAAACCAHRRSDFQLVLRGHHVCTSSPETFVGAGYFGAQGRRTHRGAHFLSRAHGCHC